MISPMLWSRDHVRSRDMLNMLSLFFCKTDDDQYWQGCGLWWREAILKDVWPSNHLVIWGHVTNQKRNIFSSAMHAVTKLGRLLTDSEVNPPMKSKDSLITWPREIMWQAINRIHLLPQDLLPPTLVTYPWNCMTL